MTSSNGRGGKNQPNRRTQLATAAFGDGDNGLPRPLRILENTGLQGKRKRTEKLSAGKGGGYDRNFWAKK